VPYMNSRAVLAAQIAAESNRADIFLEDVSPQEPVIVPPPCDSLDLMLAVAVFGTLL
jgi:hypothetical protein